MPEWTLAAALHRYVEEIVYVLMVVLEFFGAIVIFYGAVLIFVRFFTLKYSQPCTDMRIRFARTISLSLEFYLAAEILKTVMIHEPADLITVGVIVVLRAAMAVLIHWEMKHDMEDLKEEQLLRQARQGDPSRKPHPHDPPSS